MKNNITIKKISLKPATHDIDNYGEKVYIKLYECFKTENNYYRCGIITR